MKFRPVLLSTLLAAGSLAGAGHAADPAAPVAPAPAPAPGKTVPIWSLAFSPDGKTLAAGAYQRVQLWDVAGKSVTRTLTGLAGPVRCLTWSRDGKHLAAGSGKPGELGEVRVWTAAADAPPVANMREHKDVVEGVAFSNAGDALLSASVDEKILAVDLGTKKVIRAMQDHTNRISSVAVSPNGKYVATGSLDKTVKIWSGADYKPLANLDSNNGQVYTLAFLPSGDQLAVAGEDGNLRIYRLSESRTGKLTGVNGTVARTLNGNRTPIFAMGTGGNILAYGGADKTVNVYDMASGNRKHTLKECTDAVYAVAVSPDGSTVAAGSRDGKVRLWSVADGRLVAEL